MIIRTCSWSIGISKKIWIQTYFGPVTVDSVEIFRHFAFWRHGTRLASFFIVPKNCMFWGATFELIKNLAISVPEKSQGFYETLLYHCYTLVYGCVLCSISLLSVYMCVRIPLSLRSIAEAPSSQALPGYLIAAHHLYAFLLYLVC